GNHQQASLLRLDVGTGYEYWYGLPNFYTITRYNHSTHYAMAVWQLGLAVAQARGGY
ncbi:murein transglycosylase B, partial [Acinetobacter baumannii]|nr:murein transglycosylase B [Acinetobacter baumannii]